MNNFLQFSKIRKGEGLEIQTIHPSLFSFLSHPTIAYIGIFLYAPFYQDPPPPQEEQPPPLEENPPPPKEPLPLLDVLGYSTLL